VNFYTVKFGYVRLLLFLAGVHAHLSPIVLKADFRDIGPVNFHDVGGVHVVNVLYVNF
jgi:hypothetical protein